MMTQQTLVSPGLASYLAKAHLFLDTSSLILAANEPAFLNYLKTLSAGGCKFMTIPSVVYEFTRSSITPIGLNERIAFLSIATVYPIEKHFDDYKEFLYVLNQVQGKNASYTDSLLCCCLFVFRQSGGVTCLMSGNEKDVPSALFNSKGVIAVDTEKNSVRHERVFELDLSRVEAVAAELT